MLRLTENTEQRFLRNNDELSDKGQGMIFQDPIRDSQLLDRSKSGQVAISQGCWGRVGMPRLDLVLEKYFARSHGQTAELSNRPLEAFKSFVSQVPSPIELDPQRNAAVEGGIARPRL